MFVTSWFSVDVQHAAIANDYISLVPGPLGPSTHCLRMRQSVLQFPLLRIAISVNIHPYIIM